MIRLLFSVFLIVFCLLESNAQIPDAAAVTDTAALQADLVLDKGVPPHRDIDAIYAKFSEAYRTLDDEKVAGLYTETAAYLPPDGDILQTRQQIRPTFRSSFDWIRNEGRTVNISFLIVQRRVGNDLAYDVGIYTIRQYKEGKQVGFAKGKFVVVALKSKDGSWLFQVDGYSALKAPESD